MDEQVRQAEIQALRTRLAELERGSDGAPEVKVWTPPQFYTAYEIMGGAILGCVGACASLLFNIAGASLTGRYPLELVRVYLTFGLGEGALQTGTGPALATGVCLYVGTGMLLGVPIHLVLSKYFRRTSLPARFAAMTVIGLALWLINYYALLSWLQPLLFGGRWIVDLVPWYVAAATHLVFTWTMLAAHRWGEFVSYAPRPRMGTPATR